MLSAVESLHRILIQVLSHWKCMQRMSSYLECWVADYLICTYCGIIFVGHTICSTSLYTFLSQTAHNAYIQWVSQHAQGLWVRVTMFRGSTLWMSRTRDPTLNLNSSCNSSKAAGWPTFNLPCLCDWVCFLSSTWSLWIFRTGFWSASLCPLSLKSSSCSLRASVRQRRFTQVTSWFLILW